MIIKHCGSVLTPKQREIDPTPAEEAQGVVKVKVLEYYCPGNACRKRLLYWQKHPDQPFARVRQHERGALIRRLQLAKESDWVWGCHRELYTQIKITVR